MLHYTTHFLSLPFSNPFNGSPAPTPCVFKHVSSRYTGLYLGFVDCFFCCCFFACLCASQLYLTKLAFCLSNCPLCSLACGSFLIAVIRFQIKLTLSPALHPPPVMGVALLLVAASQVRVCLKEMQVWLISNKLSMLASSQSLEGGHCIFHSLDLVAKYLSFGFH